MPKKSPEVGFESDVKFVQITTASDGALYALDAEGRVFYYEDGDQEGWFQLEHDATRIHLGWAE